MSASAPNYVDIDAALISGDLPVLAYLDPGFDAYLNRTLSTSQPPSRYSRNVPLYRH